MKSKIPVIIVSVILLAYTVLASSGIALRLSILIFSLSPIFILWMVIRVLKSPDTSHKTFDAYFYDDADIRRSEETEVS